MISLKQMRKDREAVREFWRTHGLPALTGEAYQRRRDRAIYTHNWMAITRSIIELGELEAGKKVVDVGCGWGRIIVGLKKTVPGLSIHGIDLVHDLVQHAKMVVPAETGSSNTQLSVGDAESLPLTAECFDAAVSARVLQYVPNPARALREFARVVVPGGKVVVLLPNKLNPVRWFTYPAKLYGPHEIRQWFEEAGLEEIEARSICFSPTWTYFGHQSRILYVEALQRVPVVKYLGGMAVVSGRRPRLGQ